MCGYTTSTVGTMSWKRVSGETISRDTYDERGTYHRSIRTTLCHRKNDTDVALYNFNSHRPILVIFGRNVAEGVHYQTVVSYPTSSK